MKVVNEEKQVVTNAAPNLPNGYTRVYNKLNGSSVDVHTVDALDYVRKLPQLWSLTPVAKEQAKAEDAEIVVEPIKEPVAEEKLVKSKAHVIAEEKPVSARSRKLAKFEN